MKQANIKNNVVVQVIDFNWNSRHPNSKVSFTTVNEDVQVGWIRDENDVLVAPPYVEPEELVEEENIIEASILSVPAFKTLFTMAERVAIELSDNIGVNLMWDDIQDPKTLEIHLGLDSVKEGVHYLEELELIGEGRALEILES